MDGVDKLYVECACHSDEHMHKYTFWWDDPGYPVIYVTHFLNARGFWSRIWTAIKYICGYKCKYGHFDESIIDDIETATQIRDMLNQFINLKHSVGPGMEMRD